MASSIRPFLDALGSIAVLYDAENHVVELNGAAERFTGYSTAELQGRPFWQEVVAPEHADRYRHQFAHLVDNVLPDGYETWWTLRDGTQRLVLWTHRALQIEGRDLRLTTAIDVTDRRQREERLQYLAYHDELTGLANRRRFLDELEHRIASARRYGEPLGVVMIDIDGLKQVNDRLGHAAGDDVLHEVATRLRARLRRSDLSARLGGDEFAVLVSHADRDQAEQVAADLAAAVAQRPMPFASSMSAPTVSCGAAAFPQDGATGAVLMRAADERLYAGRGGRRRDRQRAGDADEAQVRAVLERQDRRQELAGTAPAQTPTASTTAHPEEDA